MSSDAAELAALDINLAMSCLGLAVLTPALWLATQAKWEKSAGQVDTRSKYLLIGATASQMIYYALQLMYVAPYAKTGYWIGSGDGPQQYWVILIFSTLFNWIWIILIGAVAIGIGANLLRARAEEDTSRGGVTKLLSINISWAVLGFEVVWAVISWSIYTYYQNYYETAINSYYYGDQSAYNSFSLSKYDDLIRAAYATQIIFNILFISFLVASLAVPLVTCFRFLKSTGNTASFVLMALTFAALFLYNLQNFIVYIISIAVFESNNTSNGIFVASYVITSVFAVLSTVFGILSCLYPALLAYRVPYQQKIRDYRHASQETAPRMTQTIPEQQPLNTNYPVDKKVAPEQTGFAQELEGGNAVHEMAGDQQVSEMEGGRGTK